NVRADDGNIAAVRIGIDGESMPLDDGAGEVELRVLVPPSARLEIRVRDERQQREPDGELAVGGPLTRRSAPPSPRSRGGGRGEGRVRHIHALASIVG